MKFAHTKKFKKYTYRFVLIRKENSTLKKCLGFSNGTPQKCSFSKIVWPRISLHWVHQIGWNLLLHFFLNRLVDFCLVSGNFKGWWKSRPNGAREIKDTR